MTILKTNSMRILFLAVVTALLSSCDTGSQTVSNQNLNTTSGYTGPAAKTADISSFQQNFWEFLKEDDRCGQCHGSGQAPEFVNKEDVNAAYSTAISYVNLQDPSSSLMVTKVAGGHNCWLTSLNACASNVEQMIINWATASNITSARQIQLTAPPMKDPGDAKSFPPSATTAGSNGSSFSDTVHPLLTANCQDCHIETASLPQAPFFANIDPASAFEAAKPKMNIDVPADSRFSIKLSNDPLVGGESHNCWTDCASDSQTMEDAIALFAQGIAITPVNPLWKTSKALNLSDGIVASGGSRHESSQIAIWEFKEGLGNSAFDTSGIDPAVDLLLTGSVTWLGGFGLDFTGGRAQASTDDSEKLHTFIQSTGQYAIEAWVVPANVTQEDSNIISYSGSDAARNFTLGQTLYNYDFYNRIDSTPSEPNGEPLLSTGANDEELLQANLQHVVANYNPFTGREIYINGNLVSVTEPVPGNTTINNVWDEGYAFLLGNETSGNRPWRGHIRMAAIHNRTLDAAQVLQNFDVGVGEKYFLLFYVGHQIAIPDSYILFEVSRFDSYSYLFNQPRFINLDPDWVPTAVNIESMRIAINGKEAFSGQAFANMNVTINATDYDSEFGQLLSPLGTIIALEKGPTGDEFFLTFENIGGQAFAYVDPRPGAAPAPADPAEPVDSDIGVRTFAEINASVAAITGIPVTNANIQAVYDRYIQQLPTIEAIDAFLPSHQMAIAQLALTSCNELVEADRLLASSDINRFFADFDYSATVSSAFDSQLKRDQIINPMLSAAANFVGVGNINNMTSQPDEDLLRETVGAFTTQVLDPALANQNYESLITELVTTSLADTNTRTAQVVKAACAATVASAVTLIQ